MKTKGILLGMGVVASLALAGHGAADPAASYAEHCADCHGEARLGGMGPALIPQTLKRMRGPKVAEVIRSGRAATQMPGFAEALDEAEIVALADWLKTPLDHIPDWGTAEITASRVMNEDYAPAAAPVWSSDPMNITLAVETGDHHVSVLDGDTFEVLDRFATPLVVHGGPKFDPQGRYVFIMSRDGWVQKYDLWSLQEVGRTRAGLNSRNIAMSDDGKWLAVANYLPMTLTILSTEDLSVAKVIPVVGKNKVDSNRRLDRIVELRFDAGRKHVTDVRFEVRGGKNNGHRPHAKWSLENGLSGNWEYPTAERVELRALVTHTVGKVTGIAKTAWVTVDIVQ